MFMKEPIRDTFLLTKLLESANSIEEVKHFLPTPIKKKVTFNNFSSPGIEAFDFFCPFPSSTILGAMQIQHFLHKHPLKWSQPHISFWVFCHVCRKDFSVRPREWHYTCRGCHFILCKTCSKLPREISHPCHPHPLTLTSLPDSSRNASAIICEDCKFIRYLGAAYRCEECEVTIDTDCGPLRTSRKPSDWVDKVIEHYTHKHVLVRCRHCSEYYYLEEQSNVICLVCELPLGESICYGCTTCEVWIHESCLDFPREIIHPIHPKHPLSRADFTTLALQITSWLYPSSKVATYSINCNSCLKEITGLLFRCNECNFNLHSGCLDLLLHPIRIDSFHPHPLVYQRISYFSYKFKRCYFCREDMWLPAESYMCFTCFNYFHFKCVPIPYNIQHRWHRHPLYLKTSAQDCYCGVCEATVIAENHAYSCDGCNFIAHIECVLSKDQGTLKFLPSLFDRESKDKQKEGEEENRNEMHESRKDERQVEDVLCYHRLCLMGKKRHNVHDRKCRMCNLQLDYPYYGCQDCHAFEAHKDCAELPTRLFHSRHPNHPLTLFPQPMSGRGYAICDICNHIFTGFNFFCRNCSYTIDIKCARSIQDSYLRDHRGQQSEEKMTRTHISVNGEKHSLRFGLVEETLVNCRICLKSVIGQVYFCTKCYTYYHGSCLDLPKEIHLHPLHGKHPLRLKDPRQPDFTIIVCYACGGVIEEIKVCYECQDCQFHLHLECRDQQKGRLKVKRHKHGLSAFWANNQGLVLDHKKDPHICDVCSELCVASFYRCMDCRLDFHLRCLQLPHTIKHRWHKHELTLNDSMVGYESGHPYCTICETEWDPRLPAYFCKQCEYIVHIECIASKDNTSDFKCLGCPFKLEIKGSSTRSRRQYFWESETVYHCSHKHVLVRCTWLQYSVNCSICREGISDRKGYGCAHCEVFFHKSCISENTPKVLNRQTLEILVEHFNGNHVMSLIDTTQHHQTLHCNLCEEVIDSTAYKCDSCGIWMHKSCGEEPNLLLNPPLFEQHLTHLRQSVAENCGSLCALCKDAFDRQD